MNLRYEHLYASGTRLEVFCIRITAGFPTGPNFLRPACPYPGCQLSSFAGSCPMENIPADYWLILCCLLTPVSVHQHLSADVS